MLISSIGIALAETYDAVLNCFHHHGIVVAITTIPVWHISREDDKDDREPTTL